VTELELVIGTKAWSSWSLRPWLALKMAGQPFRETLVALRRPDTRAQALAHSPSGKVPVLKHAGIAVWDSLAICEYLAETFPQAGLWPADRAARACARSVSAEMHAGFAPLRAALPMDVAARHPTPPMTAELAADIQRIQALWRQCRADFGTRIGGPFLFGRFSIADAMYAPVATRFVTYGVALDDVAADYVGTILDLPAMREWIAAA
jgi:glutathione S-transferase